MLRETAIVCAATLTLLTSWGCSGEGPAGHTPAAPLSGRMGGMNVVFISVDTLRADHVGCYGHPGGATDQIDRLATEGTRFDVCISSCPTTLPSHSTMMTGTYPFVHGARNNGTFVLDEENVTLAEVLRDAGYATHAEIGAAVLEAQFGLAQGFDGYGDTFVDEQRATRDAPEASVKLHDTQRSARAVSDAALGYLESRRGDDQPFFLFVHYFDPHQPYDAPEPYAGEHESGYLAEVAYTDAQVGRVLDVLRTPGFAGRTLVVLTSDHGDGFGEHDEFSHGSFLYDTTLRVPLVIWGPGRIPAGQVAPAQVGLVDILPTILELTGLEPSAETQGTSLLPLLEDPSRDLRLSTYSETFEARLVFGYSELRALSADGWKYIHGPRPELYEVAKDPAEAANRATRDPAQRTAMHASLRELLATSPPLLGRGEALALETEDIERLAALGYASAAGPDDEDDPHFWTDELVHFDAPGGISPMDKARDIYFLYLGLGAMRDGNHGAAIEAWSVFLKLNPTYAPAHSYLAQCYATVGRRADAIPSLRRALELAPDRCDDYQILGSMLADTGEREEAREQFEQALACDPDHVLAAINLGKVLLLLEDHAAAITALDGAIERVPDKPQAHVLRAKAMRALSRGGEAIDGLHALLGHHPGDVAVRLELAGILAEIGRVDEARSLHDESVRLLPRNTSIRLAAARFSIDRGDSARALEQLERGLRAQPGNVGLSALRVQLLATATDPAVRDGERARTLSRALLKIHGNDPRVLGAAAASAAERGDLVSAVDLVQRAVARARERDARALVARLEAELESYSDL